jgi:hypothetical protein
MKIRHIAMAVAVALGSSYASADTSSAIRGRISNPEGAAAAGTKVIILHVPSGTSRTVVTNETGSFVASGLRVGGPYKVIVDSDTFNDETVNDIFLQLGDTYQLNRQLQPASVERISVTGSAIAFSSTGSSSYFGAEDLEKAPSFNRDIKDMVRNNPLVVVSSKDGEMSVAGTNPRFNSITVDGISQNDDFGLNANGYPTQRSPISIEALDQVSVETSPFNAKYGGFQGALVNAVTKSGANETFGSFTYESMRDSWAGTPNDGKRDIPLNFKDTTLAGTLGGAIVEDKLFYFVSAETFDGPAQVEWGPQGSSAPNLAGVSQADYDAIRNIAKSVYGVEAGTWDQSPEEKDEKLLVKLDWNINDEHRAAFTYQYNKGNLTQNTSENSGELRLSSHWYNKQETLNNFALKLYSDWSSEFSTQISATYMDVATDQISGGSFGDVTVRVGSNQVTLGSDLSRHSNDLRKKNWILAVDGDYLLDEHKLSFGYQMKQIDIFNLFLQSTKGEYLFDSIADFQNRRGRVFYRNAVSNNADDAAAAFVRNEHTLYVQDEYAFNDDLTLDFGLRYELLTSDDTPTYNKFSEGRTGYSNTENLDGANILLPRIGFKYLATDDLTLRGGVGRFSGGQPTVWVSNSYSNPGVGRGQTPGLTAANNAYRTGLSIDQVPADLLALVASSTTQADVNLVDPNYKLPSDWRAQIAADYVFSLPLIGDDINWSTEYLYVKRQDTSFWIDASFVNEATGTTADGGRTIYTDNDGTTRDLMLTNADKNGRSKIFATMLNKNWDSGVSATLSYTHQDITDSHTSTSSTASSNYGFNNTINRHDSFVSTSAFETKHRFVFNLGYTTEFFSGYATTFSSFFERRSGKSITYYVDGNQLTAGGKAYSDPYGLLSPGTTSDAFLPYIATENDPNVIFTSEADRVAYYSVIKAFGLDKYAGGYAPKGVTTGPWVTTWDISIRQELPGLADGHKGILYLTVDNFLNLLDSSKGKDFGSDFGTLELHDFTIDPVTKKYIYGMNRSSGQITVPNRNYDKFYTEASTWRLKVGVTYRF